ncbi:hypothetical protein P154DRAFT_619610 [Amniculicola lignicola CBS 123094]|uniref:Uncharacterized protein n=1 Tax=Amniculicola lignicola CBS 123094 TaxID=1392246 RepID=A0A6A5WHJ6_9PLEO|nr:hypothetical protein P154DRAFT_619610 [Amniculicola lignicola CBS 123094]
MSFLYYPLIFSLLIPSATSQCGSLVTYRQHADLLQTAPKCLHDGCSPGKNASSISSVCPSSSPCSPYWNLFVEQFDQKNSWCSTCSSDLACRIRGWPVMNATTMCETTTNTLIFGEQEGGCCVDGNEPFELAEWTGNLCNGSEWRQPFDICGGMACLDWHDWIMPWNWTVMNENVPREEQKCTRPSYYLATYAAEHFLYVVFGVIFVFARLWRARKRAEGHPTRYILLSLMRFRWRSYRQYGNTVEEIDPNRERDPLRPNTKEKLRWAYPVGVGIAGAGLQLGLDFLAAYRIKSQPGYHHISLHLLAFLFSCRPRLTWLPCVLALISRSQLSRWFGFLEESDGYWAAKLILSAVAVTSAVTEAVTQLFGAYFFFRTTIVGREREFYLIHHLRPKIHGKEARRMYLGALFWVILCIPLLFFWFLIAAFFGSLYHIVSGYLKNKYDTWRNKAERLPPLAKRPVLWLLDFIPHTDPGSIPNQVMPVDAVDGQPLPVNDDGLMNQPLPYTPAGASEIDGQPMRVYSPGSTDDQVMAFPQRRTASGRGYGALPQRDTTEEDYQVMQVRQPAHQSVYRRRRPEMRQVRDVSSAGSHHMLLEDVEHENTPDEDTNEPRFTQGLITKFDDWEGPIILAGFIFGMSAFAAQWLFWDGFVKAARERFCPPDIWTVGAIWWSTSPLVVGLPFLA